MGVCLLGSFNNELTLLLVARMLMCRADQTVTNVVIDGGAEESRFLTDQSHLLSQPPQVQLGNVVSVDVDGALNRVIEAFNQTNNGTLAGTGGTDKGGHLPGRNSKTHVIHDGDLGTRWVDMLDVGQANVTLDTIQLDAIICSGIQRGDSVNSVEDLGGRSDSVREGLSVRGDVTKLECPYHNRHQNGENAGQFRLPVDEELAALPKGQAVAKVEDQHHTGNHARKSTLDTEPKGFSILEMGIVLSSKSLLGAECNSVADRAYSLVREGATVRVGFQILLIVFHDKG